eukprot:NODE_1205_length_1238_cov_135.146341_g982_i0.p2 GENE.NODE_1205_length_1238_cov_135.146341_g982_i0~~NODE_1205_length_1238_cov_135.146341_g982_i0.p2  ORF type:complete len:205 (+),score=45.78 NODE_1205_length_1238_cov_135.146341_g982_i0:562-1176(+)
MHMLDSTPSRECFTIPVAYLADQLGGPEQQLFDAFVDSLGWRQEVCRVPSRQFVGVLMQDTEFVCWANYRVEAVFPITRSLARDHTKDTSGYVRVVWNASVLAYRPSSESPNGHKRSKDGAAEVVVTPHIHSEMFTVQMLDDSVSTMVVGRDALAALVRLICIEFARQRRSRTRYCLPFLTRLRMIHVICKQQLPETVYATLHA